jgi:Zn-finger nucleic acid-binding protein
MVYRDKHWTCPRDAGWLVHVRVGRHELMRCGHCRGAFVHPVVLHEMYDAMGGLWPRCEPIEALRPLRCPAPTCHDPLQRAQVPLRPGYAHIDSCAWHGVWFDRGVLEKVLERAGLDALEVWRP